MGQLGQRSVVSRAFLGSVLVGSSAFLAAAAAEVSRGEMAGAIRSAGYPCAHVLKLDSVGVDAWAVECNSGAFTVTRDRDGRFDVAPAAGGAQK